MDTDLTTELDAVNAVLASIGEAPVANLDDSFVDAQAAYSLLVSVNRQLQLRGWTWNTEETVTLSPQTNGKIIVPYNTLKMIPLGGEGYILRGSEVYDPATRSNTFTTGFDAQLVLLLPWEQIPEPGRQFIYLRAARRFQDRLQNDASLRRVSQADEMAAWAAYLEFEAEQAQYNVMANQNYIIPRMKRRRNAG